MMEYTTKWDAEKGDIREFVNGGQSKQNRSRGHKLNALAWIDRQACELVDGWCARPGRRFAHSLT